MAIDFVIEPKSLPRTVLSRIAVTPIFRKPTRTTLINRVLYHGGWDDIYLSIRYAIAQIDDAAEVAGFSHVKKCKPRFLSTPNNAVGGRAFHAEKRVLSTIHDRNIKSWVASIRHEGLKSSME